MKIGTSILVTSLNDVRGERLAKALADVLGLHFADAKSLVEYELFNADAIRRKCGIEYLRKRERAAIESIASYESSVIYLPYDLFQANFSLLKGVRPHIYLRYPLSTLSSKNELNKIAYADRDGYLAKKADLVVDVATSKDIGKLIEAIKEKL